MLPRVYRLIGRLESGKLSELFRAERPGGGQSVVIKLFHRRTTDLAYAKVVADTARQLRAVQHPAVAHVLEVGLVGQRLAIVREDPGRYSLGQALMRLNAREVLLPPSVALSFVLELLDALQAAHLAGVVHGALTPGNVLLTAGGHAAVADFGALAALQASKALRKTFASGRSSYRAPEVKGSEPASVASDLYAVGALAYELLTLREASTGAASVSTRAAKLPPPSRLVRRLNARIDAVIMRALEPAPARRFRTCADYAQGLRELLLANGGVPGPAGVQKFVEELFPRDMVMDGLGPVPFEEPFEVDDITSVGPLPELAEGPQPVGPRRPFSGGEVNERTPTSDGLPVFRDDAPEAERPAPPTEPAVQAVGRAAPKEAAGPAVAAWVAPPAELPEVKVAPAPPADTLRKRVRAVEDFEAREEARSGPTPLPPSPEEERRNAKTVMTFATSFKRTDVPEVPDSEKLRAQARRRAKLTAMVGAVVCAFATLGVGAHWFTHTPDPAGTAFSYLPLPIQRAFARPSTEPPPPPPSKRVKLPDFERQHPEKAFNPDADKPKPKPREKEPDCYAPPKGPGGLLTVASPRPTEVEIDGVRVCGPAKRLGVSAGTHRVRVIDTKGDQEYVSLTRFEAGKLVKLVPVFSPR